MTASRIDLRTGTKNSKAIESWPKLARAMDEAGKKLKERFGEDPLSFGAMKREVATITGLNETGIQASDFCYNLKNDDPRSNRWKVFLKVGRDAYRYVGPFFDYKEKVIHNPLQSARPKHHPRNSSETIALPTPGTHSKTGQIDYDQEGKTQCDTLLQKLLSGPTIPFDKRFETHMLSEPGLYAIQNKDGKFLHAGVSHKAGLRSESSPSILMVVGRGLRATWFREYKTEEWPQAEAKQECGLERTASFIYYVIEKDKRVRTWAEHYMLALLQPIWGA